MRSYDFPTIVPQLQGGASAPRAGWIARLGQRLLLGRLARLRAGQVTLIDGEQRHEFGRPSLDWPLQVTVHVHDPSFYAELAFGGSVGAGESYMRGDWSCSDLTSLVRIMLRNYDALLTMEKGPARLAEPAKKALHWLNRNSRAGSRRNIAAHYDLGNDFFSLFLDPTMMYSCAVFERPTASLEEASLAKLDRICRKLDLGPRDRVLEIGTGWGGFALHAARYYGCHVTTTTISKEQYAFAKQRIAEAGLQDQITLLLKDYRDLQGEYDKLVSIEMIEAVGHAYYDTFFGQCSRLLKPDGVMLLQAITIMDQRYDTARRSVDFIQRYIFPGSCIPSVAALTASIARATDMRLFHHEDIGPHYATTLRMWRERFFANIDKVRALGYPESFIRMWEFYLCYCEGGFAERSIGDAHMVFTKPLSRIEKVAP